MIDNYQATMALIKEMESALPIAANPTKRLVISLKEKYNKMKPDENLKIVKIIYMGDEGGICCQVESTAMKDQNLVVSLTHLTLKSSHPLYKQVKAYQLARIKRLAEQNSSQFKA